MNLDKGIVENLKSLEESINYLNDRLRIIDNCLENHWTKIQELENEAKVK
jgi:predicted SnoaL-like aldol condensation-catalyzing enzyme